MRIIAIILLLSIFIACKTPLRTATRNYSSIPAYLTGNFTDDYNIRYSINDTLWIQYPNIKYHILQSNIRKQYLIARNDNNNPSEAGLYTRIDYMKFQGMEPYTWGFCLTVFNAKTANEAVIKMQADRQNPKSGCGGFPFSRMKKEVQ